MKMPCHTLHVTVQLSFDATPGAIQSQVAFERSREGVDTKCAGTNVQQVVLCNACAQSMHTCVYPIVKCLWHEWQWTLRRAVQISSGTSVGT